MEVEVKTTNRSRHHTSDETSDDEGSCARLVKAVPGSDMNKRPSTVERYVRRPCVTALFHTNSEETRLHREEETRYRCRPEPIHTPEGDSWKNETGDETGMQDT